MVPQLCWHIFIPPKHRITHRVSADIVEFEMELLWSSRAYSSLSTCPSKHCLVRPGAPHLGKCVRLPVPGTPVTWQVSQSSPTGCVLMEKEHSCKHRPAHPQVLLPTQKYQVENMFRSVHQHSCAGKGTSRRSLLKRT